MKKLLAIALIPIMFSCALLKQTKTSEKAIADREDIVYDQISINSIVDVRWANSNTIYIKEKEILEPATFIKEEKSEYHYFKLSNELNNKTRIDEETFNNTESFYSYEEADTELEFDYEANDKKTLKQKIGSGINKFNAFATDFNDGLKGQWATFVLNSHGYISNNISSNKIRYDIEEKCLKGTNYNTRANGLIFVSDGFYEFVLSNEKNGWYYYVQQGVGGNNIPELLYTDFISSPNGRYAFIVKTGAPNLFDISEKKVLPVSGDLKKNKFAISPDWKSVIVAYDKIYNDKLFDGKPTDTKHHLSIRTFLEE